MIVNGSDGCLWGLSYLPTSSRHILILKSHWGRRQCAPNYQDSNARKSEKLLMKHLLTQQRVLQTSIPCTTQTRLTKPTSIKKPTIARNTTIARTSIAILTSTGAMKGTFLMTSIKITSMTTRRFLKKERIVSQFYATIASKNLYPRISYELRNLMTASWVSTGLQDMQAERLIVGGQGTVPG